MTENNARIPKSEIRWEPLEAALIDEYLEAHGQDHTSVRALPEEQARHLLTDASSLCLLQAVGGRGPSTLRARAARREAA